MKICPKCGREFQDTNTLCPTDGAVLEKAGDGLVGQTLADKYRVEELINEGGMGAVYRGTHILMDKTVAIKVLHPALAADDKIVARFSREARAASRISHPHALNVTDFGESDSGVVFLVMEYLRGHTLKEVIKSDSPMPLSRVVEIMRQVGGALDAAHSEGVVHRDLKSDNIMLVDIGGGDWAKVLDFGIAKIQESVGNTDPALTAANMIIGTPQYMSPEQCSQASEIDARSDIYSMGVILYEMLAGHLPFTGDSPTSIMMKHLQEAPPSILEERPDLPAAVGRVVARALAKRPEDRYQSAHELTESLVLASETATPVTSEAGAVTGPGSAERSTNRIVVPTGQNEPPRSTDNRDYDEETVVQPRRDATPVPVMAETVREYEGPPPQGLNPWRIIIPAAVGILIAFGIIYALTRNSGPATNNNNQQNTPLVSDPNSRPVQPASPATGQNEQGITPTAPAASTSPGASTNTSANTNTNLSGAPGGNQNLETSVETGNTNRNAKGNRNANANQNDNTAGEGGETSGDSSDNANDDARPANENRERPRETSSPNSKPSQNSNNNPDDQPSPKPNPTLPKPIKETTPDKGPTHPPPQTPQSDNPDQ